MAHTPNGSCKRSKIFSPEGPFPLLLLLGGKRIRMAPTTVRLPQSVSERIAKELRQRGHASFAAFIRTAVQNELDGRDLEHSLTSTVERFARELRRLDTAQQAEFALLDALARVLLHCLPEPPTDVRDKALAKVKERHQRLLKMAALNMQGDSRAALLELVEHGQ